MGARGPTPKPTALRLLEGNRGKRKLNPSEPAPRPATDADLHCPDHLDERARAEWVRLLPILRRMRVLTEADYIALGELCTAYSTMVDAQTRLTERGLTTMTPSGYVQQSPYLSIARRCGETVQKLCREFGLTPASRTRVQAAPDENAQTANPWENLKRPAM